MNAKTTDHGSKLVFVAVACAVLSTAVVAWRDLGPKPTPPLPADESPTFVDSAKKLAKAGHRIGPASTPIEVVVFSDVECPACSWFALTGMPAMKKRYGDSISFVYRHYPLERHPSAYEGAVALECAADQGQFEAFHDNIYRQQKLLGVKKFSEFAAESGIPDIPKFETCLADSSKALLVNADVREAEALGATGTPTIIINGWHLPGGANKAKLDTIVQALMTRSR